MPITPHSVVNTRKREQMSAAVLRVQALGWTTPQLATWMSVTAQTIGAWRRGDSMGTNLQRATLARLKSPVEERPHIIDVLTAMRREALKSENMLEEDAARGAHLIAKSRLARIARIRTRADALAKMVGLD